MDKEVIHLLPLLSALHFTNRSFFQLYRIPFFYTFNSTTVSISFLNFQLLYHISFFYTFNSSTVSIFFLPHTKISFHPSFSGASPRTGHTSSNSLPLSIINSLSCLSTYSFPEFILSFFLILSPTLYLNPLHTHIPKESNPSVSPKSPRLVQSLQNILQLSHQLLYLA